MRGLFGSKDGFSLIEIMIAVTIVGISFAVIAEGYIAMSSLVQQVKEYQLVSSFARNKMNQLTQKTDASLAGTDQLLTLEVNWNAVTADMGDGVQRVTVYVDWQSRKGQKQYQLTTLIEGGSYED